MDLRRFAMALAVALLLAVGATFVLYRNLRNKPETPQTQKVVAPVKAFDAGSTLTAENLTLIDWPANMPLTGSFGKVEDVAGRSLIYPVSEKQPILAQDLAAPGSGIGLTVKIPEGMRAISVKSNEVVGVAGFLYPGSHVDVLVSYRGENTPDMLTQTVLQNVEVLTAGQRLEPDPQGKPETVSVVTLLLTPQDSQKMVLASQQGSIQFVLRNGADTTKAPTTPVAMTDVTGEAKRPVVTMAAARVKKATKPQDFYEVETIYGGEKRETEKFAVPQ